MMLGGQLQIGAAERVECDRQAAGRRVGEGGQQVGRDRERDARSLRLD